MSFIPSHAPEYRLYGTDNVEQMPQIRTISVDNRGSQVKQWAAQCALLQPFASRWRKAAGVKWVDDGYRLRPMPFGTE